MTNEASWGTMPVGRLDVSCCPGVDRGRCGEAGGEGGVTGEPGKHCWRLWPAMGNPHVRQWGRFLGCGDILYLV